MLFSPGLTSRNITALDIIWLSLLSHWVRFIFHPKVNPLELLSCLCFHSSLVCILIVALFIQRLLLHRVLHNKKIKFGSLLIVQTFIKSLKHVQRYCNRFDIFCIFICIKKQTSVHVITCSQFPILFFPSSSFPLVFESLHVEIMFLWGAIKLNKVTQNKGFN